MCLIWLLLRCETRAAATRHCGKTRYLSVTPPVKAIRPGCGASWEAVLSCVRADSFFLFLGENVRESAFTVPWSPVNRLSCTAAFTIRRRSQGQKDVTHAGPSTPELLNP